MIANLLAVLLSVNAVETAKVIEPEAASPLHLDTAVWTGLSLGLGGVDLDRQGQGLRSWVGSGGPLLGLRSTLGRGSLDVGLAGDISTFVVTQTTAHVGAVGGCHWDPAPAFRLTALADVGVTFYRNIGGDLFTSSSGDNSATLPYAGLQLGATWRFGRERRGILGVWGSAREDLGRTVIHPVIHEFLSNDDVKSLRMGGENVGLGLTFGFEI